MTTSEPPTETCREPSLPPISRRRSAAAALATQRIHPVHHQPAPDSGIGTAILATLLLIAALLLSQALIMRDEAQIIIHQRDVAPEVQR